MAKSELEIKIVDAGETRKSSPEPSAFEGRPPRSEQTPRGGAIAAAEGQAVASRRDRPTPEPADVKAADAKPVAEDRRQERPQSRPEARAEGTPRTDRFGTGDEGRHQVLSSEV